MRIFAIACQEKIDKPVFETLLSRVGDQKKERLLKYVNKEDAHRSLVADLLIRKILIEERKIRNEDIFFSTNKFGKPYCESIKDFHFNISHSGKWIVGAVDNKPVGIDIEKISPVDFTIAKSFYAEKEYNDLIKSENPLDYFFSLWALKESYIKYLGRGFAFPLREFSIWINKNSDIELEINNRIKKDVFFALCPIGCGYKMAVCASQPYITNNLEEFKFKDLLQTFIYERTFI